MSFRSSSLVEQQKPSRQIKQKRRSVSDYNNRYDHDAYDVQVAYKRKEKYNNWKQLVDDEYDDFE